MLFLMLCYIGITCVCLWAGILFYSFIYREEDQRTVIHIILTGLMAVTAIGQWIVLVLPINALTLFFIVSLCIILTISRKKQTRNVWMNCKRSFNGRHLLFIGCFISCFLMILILNTGPFIMDDTDSYHIQVVKWIQEYGSVPGIANLHLRFGFNSSWFISIALFSYPGHGVHSIGALNGLLSIWICYYLLYIICNSIQNYQRQNNRIMAACVAIFVLCLLNWPMIRGSAASMNYDFITTCCCIILFVDLFSGIEKNRIEWMVWPVYLFTVRMMNFPLLILSLLFMLHLMNRHSFRKLFICFLGASVFVVPFLIRNCILSGYIFFPFQQIDLFSFDWKADKQQLIEISRYIKYFNRVNPMFQPLTMTEKAGFPGWVFSWFNNLFRFDKLILILSAFGYVILFFRFKNVERRSLRIFMLVMICQLICWFFIAPDPRFVYGSLLFGIFACIACLPVMERISVKIIKLSLVITSSIILVYTVSKVAFHREYRNYLTPHIIPEPAFKTITVNNIELHIPEKILGNWNPRCYDIELPCLYEPDPRLEARGKTIADGFRIKNSGPYIFKGGEYKMNE